jgi:hypothetical protein
MIRYVVRIAAELARIQGVSRIADTTGTDPQAYVSKVLPRSQRGSFFDFINPAQLLFLFFTEPAD